MTCFGQVSKCLACCRLLFCFCCDYEKDTPEVALWSQEEDETPSQTGVKWSLQPTYTHMINPDKKSWAWSRAAAAAAAAAKSLQPCCRRQPTRLLRPWDSPGKNTGVGCHFLLQCMKVKSESEVAQPRPTLSDPMDCSPPGTSVHGILQARILEWVAISFSTNPLIPSQSTNL